MTEHWHVGGFFSIDNSRDYNNSRVGFYLRYVTHPPVAGFGYGPDRTGSKNWPEAATYSLIQNADRPNASQWPVPGVFTRSFPSRHGKTTSIIGDTRQANPAGGLWIGALYCGRWILPVPKHAESHLRRTLGSAYSAGSSFYSRSLRHGSTHRIRRKVLQSNSRRKGEGGGGGLN